MIFNPAELFGEDDAPDVSAEDQEKTATAMLLAFLMSMIRNKRDTAGGPEIAVRPRIEPKGGG